MLQRTTGILTSATGSAAIAASQSGFLPGMQVVADIYAPTNGAFNGTARWQTSVDGTTWNDVGVAFTTTGGGFNTQTITLSNFVRLNCSAFTSGAVQGRILSDVQ